MLAQIRKARQSESGFTLIELLIVIVILGVLAGVVVFAVGGITDKGKTAACKADYKTIQVAAEAYFANGGTGSYADTAGLVAAKLLGGTPKLYSASASGSAYTITYVDAKCVANAVRLI